MFIGIKVCGTYQTGRTDLNDLKRIYAPNVCGVYDRDVSVSYVSLTYTDSHIEIMFSLNIKYSVTVAEKFELSVGRIQGGG